MTVFFITTWDEPCGIAGYSRNLVEGLKKIRPDIDIQVNRIEKRFFGETYKKTHADYWMQLCDRISVGDVVHIQHEFSFFGETVISSNKNFIKILNLIRIKGARVVITFHTLLRDLSWVDFLHDFRRRRMASLHGLLVYRSWLNLARFINKQKITCLVHTMHSRGLLVNTGILAESVGVVPAGVGDYFDAPMDKRAAKECLKYSEDDFLVATFGFVAAYKGIDIACEAISNLPNRFKLVIAGSTHPDNAKDRTLENLVSKYVDNERIKFLGYVSNEEMRLLKAGTDLFVAPYREVGLASSAAINAGISSGIPVIASNIEAFLEVNRSDEVIALVGQEQPNVLALEIAKLADDVERRERLIARGKQYAMKNSWKNVASLHLNYYEQR